METRLPVRPTWKDFTIEGKPLFDTCQDYLNSAQELIGEARKIATAEHSGGKLTAPPRTVLDKT